MTINEVAKQEASASSNRGTPMTRPARVEEAINDAQELFKSHRYAIWKTGAHHRTLGFDHSAAQLNARLNAAYAAAAYSTEKQLLWSAFDWEAKRWQDAAKMSWLHYRRGFNVSARWHDREAMAHRERSRAYCRALECLVAFNRSQAA